MNGLPKPAYVLSEPHLSGYRVVIGYETLTEAQNAQAALCQPQAREEATAKAELYDHMKAVAEANGFATLTEAIAVAYKAREEAGPEDYEDILREGVKERGLVVPHLLDPPSQPLGADAEKLRIAVEALEPFARAADGLDGLWSEDDWRWNDSVRSNVTVRDLRRSRDAIAALQQEGR